MAFGDKTAAAAAPMATVIGETILINGELRGEEDLTVRGRVEGSISLTRTLVIEPTGIVKADVSVKHAIISGVVVGNVTATDSVEITEQGRMVGDIRAPRVIIVDGASFRGGIDMGDIDLPRTERGEPAARPAAPPASRPAVSSARSSAPARPSAPSRPAAPARPAPVSPLRPAAPARSSPSAPRLAERPSYRPPPPPPEPEPKPERAPEPGAQSAPPEQTASVAVGGGSSESSSS